MRKSIAFVCCFFLFSLVAGVSFSEQIVLLGDRHEKSFSVGCDGCHDENPPSKKVGTEKCVSCHGTFAEFGQMPKQKSLPNPHINHNDELYCEDCHHSHKPPVNFCSQCHDFSYIIP